MERRISVPLSPSVPLYEGMKGKKTPSHYLYEDIEEQVIQVNP